MAATVAVAFVVYAVLAHAVESPRVFSDELLYFDAAAAVVEGDGLTIRGRPYRYAPLYPALLVPFHWIAPDREAAYELAKTLNALLFALTALPVFLLARRVLPAWHSAAAAALSVAIPSASYVSVVMTESLAYFACSWALLAIVLALERPSVLRQFAALLSIVVAAGVRTQFLLLFAVYLLGLVLLPLIVPGRRARPKATLASLWPSWGALALGAGSLVVAAAFGSDASSRPVGPYSALWRSYDPGDVGRWLVYHLANIELYLAVVPLAVAPIVLASMFGRGRRGSERQAAFLVLFVTVNAVLLLLTAAFNTTEYAVETFHDRTLFYVIPLWLIVLFAWLAAGTPRPRLAVAVGAGLALALPLLLPFSEYAKDDARQQFNGVGTTLWASIDQAAGGTGSGRVVLIAFALVLVVATLLLRDRSRLLPLAVAAVFVLSGALSWHLAARAATTWAATVPREERRWLDRQVPPGRSVTAIAAVETCRSFLPRDAFYLTEFFNASVRQVGHVGTPPDSLGSATVSVTSNGRLALPSGAPLVADYVLAQPAIRFVGRRVAEGTSARLALWEIGGVVRALGVDTTRELEAVACSNTLR